MTEQLQPEERVELHPATSWWMRGARFGTVIKQQKNGLVRVQLDRTGRVIKLRPENVERV